MEKNRDKFQHFDPHLLKKCGIHEDTLVLALSSDNSFLTSEAMLNHTRANAMA